MKVEAEQVLCRFQCASDERHAARSLHEWIVDTARRLGLQGATVLEGFAGFRLDGKPLDQHAWPLAKDLPVVVEVVDTAEAIERLLQVVEPEFCRGTITLERAHVVRYRVGGDGHAPPATPEIVTSQGASTAREVTTMTVPENGVLLRIFIGEDDREPGGRLPLFEAIVRRAREAHLAGATVLRGPMGFGRHSRVHTARFLDLSADLPVVIEIVDAEDRINAFLPTIDELVTEGLVTMEAVRVFKYASPDTP